MGGRSQEGPHRFAASRARHPESGAKGRPSSRRLSDGRPGEGHAALGDVDKGIEWLSRAFDERTQWLIWVRLDDGLAPLRADPRYAALDRQLRY